MEMADTNNAEKYNVQNSSKGSFSFEDYTSLEEFTQAGFQMLMEIIKKSNKMPFGRTRDLYESFPDFKHIMKNQGDSITSILAMMINNTKLIENFSKMDDEDKFETIVDINDTLLENVGILLDELSGIKRNPEVTFIEKNLNIVSGSWNKKNNIGSKNVSNILNTILTNTKNIAKPQLLFEDKIDNDPLVPFEPKITYKYNMLKPLSILLEENGSDIRQFSHPYEFELLKFKPSEEMLTMRPPIPYKPLENTPLHLVVSSEDVNFMVEDLEKYKEISVDLEHHSYRSFQGFTCLMQISTRDRDYIIDTIKLRSKLQILNKIFTDPSIVKVFHGADMDILWLQKDLGLYVVNMFDTHQGAKLLNFPKLSLAYLLSYYCKVNAQKHLQLADWRIRPLPEELITYAREDTHYLLFIYDNLRNSLIEKANGQTKLLESAIFESTTICLKKYIKPLYEKEGYLEIYQKSKKLFDNRQKFALESLFKWRDKIARKSDESYAYVLPNHMMLNISEILPREAQGILACCNPIPIPVRQNLLQLHEIILKAREQPLIKPVLEEQKLFRFTSATFSVDNPLQCPHDLIHEGDFRDNLPILLDSKKEIDQLNFLNKRILFRPKVDVFKKSKESRKICNVKSGKIHSSPYQWYKLAKKFLESSENKNLIRNGSSKTEKGTNGDLLEQKGDSMNVNCDKSEVRSPEVNLAVSNVQPENNFKLEANEEAVKNNKNETERDRSIHPPKKIKKENTEIVSNSDFEYESTLQSYLDQDKKINKKKKKNSNSKKESKKTKKKEAEYFDYNSIDFNKYSTKTGSEAQKFDQLQKKKKKKIRSKF